jgi:hypothetical protein
MSYYPAGAAEDYMWTHWNVTSAAMPNDFKTMAANHVNVVRLLLFTAAFGYPNPSPTIMNELRTAVNLAGQNGLRVQLSMFLGPTDYTDIAGSQTYAKAMLAPYAHDSRIAFIELKNEIPVNPNDQNGTEVPAAMAWARVMVPYLQNVVEGSIPITLSVTFDISQNLGTLITNLGSSQPDFYDVHLYNDAPWASYYQLHAAQAAAIAQGRALLIGETGKSTYPGQFGGFPSFATTTAGYEAWQDYSLRMGFLASSALGLPPTAPWIFSDYVLGAIPNMPTDKSEYHFGLYHTDGSPKAAAITVSNVFGSGTLDTSFNNGFEQYGLVGGYNQPFLWTGDTPSQASYADDCTTAHSGSCAAKIWNSGASTGTQYYQQPGFYLNPVANIVPGTTYTASVWVKGLNATGTTQICLQWLQQIDSDIQGPTDHGAWVCTNTSSLGTAWQGTWKQLSVTGKAPAGTASARINLQSGHNTGAAWFDDVTFQ